MISLLGLDILFTLLTIEPKLQTDHSLDFLQVVMCKWADLQWGRDYMYANFLSLLCFFLFFPAFQRIKERNT